MHLSHEKHEHGNNEQNREAGNQELGPHRLLLRLLALHRHVVGEQVVHQLGVFHHRSDGFEAGSVFSLCTDGQPVHQDFRQAIRLHFADKFRITYLFGPSPQIKVIEYRE